MFLPAALCLLGSDFSCFAFVVPLIQTGHGWRLPGFLAHFLDLLQGMQTVLKEMSFVEPQEQGGRHATHSQAFPPFDLQSPCTVELQ